MKTSIDLDAITIDGNKLREAREARNLSIAELAAFVTLSRDQVRQIEEGGDRSFYTPAHKLLAVRKYAGAMDLAYDEVVTGPGADQTVPAPDDAPASMLTPQEGIEPADLRLAAVERNAEIRRLVLIGAITLTILLAIYAKVRGAKTNMDEEVADPAYATETSKADPTSATKTPAVADKTSTVDTVEVARANDAVSQCPVPPAAGDPKVWSPAYQYKADLRLFLISTKEGTICVTDATGKETLVILKPMIWQVVAGKPPYDVRAAQLADHKLYLQGQLVRVPADSSALRLIPTQALPPAPAAAPAPASEPANAPTPSATPAPPTPTNPDA
jgi:transcriptional regulator with XRE-family HTH domain